VGTRRGVGLVLALIFGAVLVSAAGVALAWVAVGRQPVIQRDSTLVLRLSGDVAEVEPTGVLSPIFQRRATVRSITASLRRAKDDVRVRSLMIVPAGTPPLWAKVQEIRDAILDFRTSKKPVVALLEYAGDREYYLASAADKVFLLPTSSLDLKGVASYELFLRGSLDKIGAYPDLVHVGDYKTAINTWTERGFTAAHREMSESLNRDAFDQLVDGIARGRGKTPVEVRQLVDHGPFLPEAAVRAGLVDGLAYEDQVDDRVKLGPTPLRIVDMDTYAGGGYQFGFGGRARIAVVYAVGTIVSGQSRQGAQGDVIGSNTLVETIRTVREDNSVKAVVLRIDSPGGSSVASDVIWRELMLMREKKPLIVSMSDLAASGGYYIAMPAQTIVAQPGTLTGSIGIFGGKFVFSGTLDKVGANLEAVTSGQHAAMDSPIRPYTPEERARVEAQMRAFYEQFVAKVAKARASTPERIDAIAQGRVWTGRQAKDLGLVDELGGLDHAITVARQKARLGPGEVDVTIYPPYRSLYELVSDPFSERYDLPDQAARIVVGRDERRAAAALLSPARFFRPGEPLALMPFVFRR
jgi:protease-4